MTKWMKILIGTGITGGLLAGLGYALRIKRTGKELEVVTKVNLHKLDFTGITLRADSVLKNPSGTKLKIKFPFVKLYYKDSLVGASEVINKDIEIPAYGEGRIEKIMIQIPLMGLLSVGAGLFKSVQDGNEVKIKVITRTAIDLGIQHLPYQTTEEVTLKKASHGS